MYFFFRIIAAHIYHVRLQTFFRGLYGDLVCMCVYVCVCYTLHFPCLNDIGTYQPTCVPRRKEEKKHYIHLPFCKTRFSCQCSPLRRPTIDRPFAFSATCWFITNTMTTRHYITYTAPMQQVTESDMRTSHNNVIGIPLPPPYGRRP